MTTDKTDYRSHTSTPFRREEKRTHLRETLWTNTGMRSLNASYSDGLHSLSFITHDKTDDRQTVLNIHRTDEISVSSDDSLALTISIRSDDGTPLTLSFHDVSLGQLMDALDLALLEKSATATETV